MAQYIHLFDTASEFNEAYNGSSYEEPWVSYTEEGEKVNYNKSEEEKEYEELLETPLTFEITSPGDIIWTARYSSTTKTIEYTKNDGEWVSITSSTGGTKIPVQAGDVVKFKGNNTTYTENNGIRWNVFSAATCGFTLKGNIMSMFNSTDFANLIIIPNGYPYNLNNFFYACTGLTDASKLILPATTLEVGCYAGMFQGCTNLTKSPKKLPTADLQVTSCYQNMFRNCTSLTTAPELPATTLYTSCYAGMFQGCTSLTTAPELPAKSLYPNSYQIMFKGCTSLNYVKCLATKISATNCTQNWLDGVSNRGTFIKDANMSDWTTGINGIPDGWTVVDV